MMGGRPLPGQSLIESEASKPTAWYLCGAERQMLLPDNPSEHIKSLD